MLSCWKRLGCSFPRCESTQLSSCLPLGWMQLVVQMVAARFPCSCHRNSPEKRASTGGALHSTLLLHCTESGYFDIIQIVIGACALTIADWSTLPSPSSSFPLSSVGQSRTRQWTVIVTQQACRLSREHLCATPREQGLIEPPPSDVERKRERRERTAHHFVEVRRKNGCCYAASGAAQLWK